MGNNETKVMDCHGSWDQMQMTMKEKLGDTWEDIKQNMTSMTGVIDKLKMGFDKVSGAIQNALKPAEDTRRKRETDEEASAEPEPEPEADDYYCIKQTVAGHTLKSCLPKSVADPVKMACGMILGAGDVCVCNDKDLCNSSSMIGSNIKVSAMLSIFFIICRSFVFY